MRVRNLKSLTAAGVFCFGLMPCSGVQQYLLPVLYQESLIAYSSTACTPSDPVMSLTCATLLLMAYTGAHRC